MGTPHPALENRHAPVCDSLRRPLHHLHRRRMTTRMDAAVPVDAQNAPTRPWKTAQNAVSHSAHTHHRQRLTHKKPDTPPHVERCTVHLARFMVTPLPRSLVD